MNLFRIALVTLIAVVAGVVGYQLGLAQGLAGSGATGPVAYYPGFGFGFLGLLFPLLFLFLIFALARGAFWGARGPEHWERHGWSDAPRRLEEWHRHAHGQSQPAKTPPTV